jgi:Transglycosylase SLT domain
MAVDTSNATATAGVDPSRVRIAGAIKQAANTTGTSFEYLLATAKMESDFNPTAGASTSSAHGLYQFIDQTWLGTVKEAGAQLGYGNYADAITKSPSGDYSVSDPTARTAIMKLRDDPVASSAMAAALTQSNSFELTGKIGRRPTDSELYMAHFMGVGGAAKLISSAEDSPQASGAALFPNAAAANRSIFFDHSGRAYSVSQVYSVLSSRYASAAGSPTARSAIATFGASPVSTGATGTQITKPAFLSSFPDVQPAAMASASTSPATSDSTPAVPIFRSLFQVGERSQPVSPAIHELWGNSSSLTSVAVTSATPVASAGSAASAQAPSSPAQAATANAPQPLDLFSDRTGAFSS